MALFRLVLTGMSPMRVLPCLLSVLLWVASAGAATVTVVPGTPLYFGDSGQTPTPAAIMTLSGLTAAGGANPGRVSARLNLGASHTPDYSWRCTFSLTGANTLDQSIGVYLATSDALANGQGPDGEIGTADATLTTTNKLRNVRFLGQVLVDQTTTNTIMTGSGPARILEQYVSLIVMNTTLLPFQTSSTLHKCSLTPMVITVN